MIIALMVKLDSVQLGFSFHSEPCGTPLRLCRSNNHLLSSNRLNASWRWRWRWHCSPPRSSSEAQTSYWHNRQPGRYGESAQIEKTSVQIRYNFELNHLKTPNECYMQVEIMVLVHSRSMEELAESAVPRRHSGWHMFRTDRCPPELSVGYVYIARRSLTALEGLKDL